MKRLLVVLLFVSIAGNIAFVGAFALRSRHEAGKRPTPSDGDGSTPAASTDIARPHASARAEFWRSLDSADFHVLLANLRAAGVPEDMVRTIVSALLNARYESRRLALIMPSGLPPFWKQDVGSGFDPEKLRELGELSRELRQARRDLLGSGGPASDFSEYYRRFRYGPLPEDKFDLIEAVSADYNDLIDPILIRLRGAILPWDREQLALIGAEMRKDIAAVLTPEEFETYELYSSSTANSLRARFTAFDATEEEFRDIFRLQSSFDAKYSTAVGGMTFPTNVVMTDQRRADQQALNRGIKDALGEQRYAEYQRSQDPGYRAAYGVVARLNLPAENAAGVYDMQKELQKRVIAIRSDKSLDNEQRSAALAGLASEANQKLSALLTAQGVEAYKQSGGMWLRALESPTGTVKP